jgi:hypothetical protein
MPAEKYGFRPHPESMDFAALISHIATSNYQFCAGWNDSDAPALPAPASKDAVVKFLADSFAYGSSVLAKLTPSNSSARRTIPRTDGCRT